MYERVACLYVNTDQVDHFVLNTAVALVVLEIASNYLLTVCRIFNHLLQPLLPWYAHDFPQFHEYRWLLNCGYILSS